MSSVSVVHYKNVRSPPYFFQLSSSLNTKKKRTNGLRHKALLFKVFLAQNKFYDTYLHNLILLRRCMPSLDKHIVHIIAYMSLFVGEINYEYFSYYIETNNIDMMQILFNNGFDMRDFGIKTYKTREITYLLYTLYDIDGHIWAIQHCMEHKLYEMLHLIIDNTRLSKNIYSECIEYILQSDDPINKKYIETIDSSSYNYDYFKIFALSRGLDYY